MVTFGMVTLGYSEFIKLFNVSDVDDVDDFFPNLALRPEGVYVKRPTKLAKRTAHGAELAELTRHPTGNIKHPALSFPCSVGDLKKFVGFYGLHGYINAFTLLDVLGERAAEQSQSHGSSDDRVWPWGNHETKLLRHLAAAGDRFWKNYNPDSPSTANTSEVVSAWLQEKDVAKRVAEVMAQILRADNLKTGPR